MRNLRQVRFCVCVFAFTVAAFLAGASAAVKTYQFTGVVKTADATTFSVEKNAKETWTFEKGDVKALPKVGDKVTVEYKMVATNIEAKPAATPAKKK
jgi:basic membrane lipoprotein Med (substrate-binding protein (PBP1-ABC) superfamily)